MFIRGLMRGLRVDRKRILMQRTPLVITQPAVAKKVAGKIAATIIPKVIERGSVGSGKSSAGTQKSVIETKRASSNTSPTTKFSTSKKTVSSPAVTTNPTVRRGGEQEGAGYVYQPPIKFIGGGCSLNKY